MVLSVKYYYRRPGFECEILLIMNCEFLYETQSKESQEKEYAMNITREHTPFVKCTCVCSGSDCKHTRVLILHMFDLLAHSCRSSRKRFINSSSQLSTYQHPAKCNCGSSSINSPPHNVICSITSHASIAKIEGVAFPFGNSQSLESQSGLYSTIRNRLTMHSKPDLWYIIMFVG